MQLKVKINGADVASHGFAAVETMSEDLKNAVTLGQRNGLEKIGLVGIPLVIGFTPVGATGNLAAGMTYEVQGPAVEIFASAPADVYSAPVDLGAKPHFPPSAALLLWVKKKLNIDDEKQAKSVAFLIARKISRTGIKGAKMFELAFEKLDPQAVGIVELEIARAVQAAGFGVK